MTNMTQIGIAGSGSRGVYAPVNADKFLADVFPVVGPVPAHVEAIDANLFDSVEEYIGCVQGQALYFQELLKDVEDLDDVLLDQYGMDGNWFYVFQSTIPADIAEFAEIWQEDPIEGNQELLDVFADSAAFEMGRNSKRYGKVSVEDAVQHEAANYTIAPNPDGNGAVFKRKEVVEGAPVRASTAVEDPWAPLSEGDHF